MIYIQLITEFIKISLFSFGGGYGTLPFIYYIANEYNWYGTKEIMHMVAIAAVTPGAFGVNMATYAGFKTLGCVGALLATSALVVPSVILSVMIYKLLKKYRGSNIVQDGLETLRAVAVSSTILSATVFPSLSLTSLASSVLEHFASIKESFNSFTKS